MHFGSQPFYGGAQLKAPKIVVVESAFQGGYSPILAPRLLGKRVCLDTTPPPMVGVIKIKLDGFCFTYVVVLGYF